MKKTFTFAIMLTTLISCTTYDYIPVKQNVMTFQNKGDILVSGSLGLYNGLGIDLGYSFTDYLGIYSSFNRFNISGYQTCKPIKDFFWDNELILYRSFKFGLYTSINLGYGLGRAETGTPWYNEDIHREFIQPSLGWSFENMFQLAISSRITQFNRQINSSIDVSSAYDRMMFTNYFGVEPNSISVRYYIEPAVTAIYNLDYMKFKFQYSFTGENYPNVVPVNMTTSIELNLNKLIFNKSYKNRKLRWTF